MQIKQTQSSFPAEAPDTQKLGSSNFWVPFPAQPLTLKFSLSSHNVKNALNHQRKGRNLHHIYYEFQHHSKTEHREKKKFPPEATQRKSFLSVLSKYRGVPLPQWHLHHAAGFNINLPLGPQLNATAGKQNKIQQKSLLLSKGIWHYVEKAAKMKWL